MNRSPQFDHTLLSAALRAGRLPTTATREGRIALLGEFADTVLAERAPNPRALLFIATAIQSWLTNGGNLERDYLGVAARAGSHLTPSAIWRAQQREARNSSSS